MYKKWVRTVINRNWEAIGDGRIARTFSIGNDIKCIPTYVSRVIGSLDKRDNYKIQWNLTYTALCDCWGCHIAVESGRWLRNNQC